MKVKNGRKRIITRILGKIPRKEKNLERIFHAMLDGNEFSGPELRRQRVKTSWFYNVFLPAAINKLIKPSRTVKSPGRGQTQYYKPTLPGRMVAAFFLRRIDVFKDILKEIGEKEDNPLTKFAIQCFLEYEPELFWKVIDKSFSSAFNNKHITSESVSSLFINGLFDVSLFTVKKAASKEEKERFDFVVKMMEQNPNRECIFWYFKTLIESLIIKDLTGKKLKHYIDSLKKTPQSFHLPCLNKDCTNILTRETLFLPDFCPECKRKKEKSIFMDSSRS